MHACGASVATTQARRDLGELSKESRRTSRALLPQADANLAPSLVLLMTQARMPRPGGARAALDVLAPYDRSTQARRTRHAADRSR
jgi:hypothetical protein